MIYSGHLWFLTVITAWGLFLSHCIKLLVTCCPSSTTVCHVMHDIVWCVSLYISVFLCLCLPDWRINVFINTAFFRLFNERWEESLVASQKDKEWRERPLNEHYATYVTAKNWQFHERVTTIARLSGGVWHGLRELSPTKCRLVPWQRETDWSKLTGWSVRKLWNVDHFCSQNL